MLEASLHSRHEILRPNRRSTHKGELQEMAARTLDSCLGDLGRLLSQRETEEEERVELAAGAGFTDA